MLLVDGSTALARVLITVGIDILVGVIRGETLDKTQHCLQYSENGKPLCTIADCECPLVLLRRDLCMKKRTRIHRSQPCDEDCMQATGWVVRHAYSRHGRQ